MALKGTGVLAVWTDVEPDMAAEFDHWYVKEHIPERAHNPGFLSGRRYERAGDGPKSFAFYEAETPEALASPAYIEVLRNPTDWSRRVMPRFRGTQRMVGRVAASAGRGIGAAVATLRLSPLPEREAELLGWLADEAFPALLRDPAVVGAHLFEPDPDVTERTSRELGIAPPERGQPPVWAVVVDGTSAAAVALVTGRLLPDAALAAHGADGPAIVGLYTLMYALAR